MVSMYVIMGMLSFVSLYFMGRMCTSCFSVLSFFLTFYIARRLRVCFKLYGNAEVILTQEKPDHLQKELAIWCVFTICALCFSYFIPLLSGFNFVEKAYLDLFQVNSQILIITFLIWAGIFSLKKLTKSEILYLSTVNNLTLGYGVAIWYYKNYLDRILPDNFLMRVRKFKSIEGVRLPHKLYILCPKSCKVKKYIDNSDCIEFSKDLPPHQIDHGGIIDRKYSISVYRIKYHGEFFRCALEYAQPLKTLLALKNKNRISLSKMHVERESFLKNLNLMLRDHKNSFEVCELVEFDDETEELCEILSSLPSVQPFKRPTIE